MRKLAWVLILGVVACGGGAMSACSSNDSSNPVPLSDAAVDATQKDGSGGSDGSNEASTIIEAGADADGASALVESGADGEAGIADAGTDGEAGIADAGADGEGGAVEEASTDASPDGGDAQ
jgi:hypothetical protein